MSHTDFITPFTIEETLDCPHDKLSETKINPEKFTELLLQRWPYTGKPSRIKVENGVYHYAYDFRAKPEDHPRELDINYSYFITIKNANKEILASLCHIYRQCVPTSLQQYRNST